MLALRVTSPDSVHGLTSDDGFEIGRVTLAGSYNLLLTVAAFGLLGAASFGLVARWLIGPLWFRSVTVALGAGAVIGAMLVHADGIDFTVLEPAWLAIACFVAIPAVFGGLIGPTLERFSRPSTWASTGRRRWLLPTIAVACFPLSLVVLALIGVVLLGWSLLGPRRLPQRLHANVVSRTLIQAGWLLVAVLGAVSLIDDISAIV